MAHFMKNMALTGGALVLFYTSNQLQGDAGRLGPRYDAVRVTLDPAGARPGQGKTILGWRR